MRRVMVERPNGQPAGKAHQKWESSETGRRIPGSFREKIQSELHGDMQRSAEMPGPFRVDDSSSARIYAASIILRNSNKLPKVAKFLVG